MCVCVCVCVCVRVCVYEETERGRDRRGFTCSLSQSRVPCGGLFLPLALELCGIGLKAVEGSDGRLKGIKGERQRE